MENECPMMKRRKLDLDDQDELGKQLRDFHVLDEVQGDDSGSEGIYYLYLN